MRVQQQWWSVLVAAVLGGLMSVTAVGEQFLPILSVREGVLRFIQIPRADGIIAYLTLLNERDGGIHGVKLVWEECEIGLLGTSEVWPRWKPHVYHGATTRGERQYYTCGTRCGYRWVGVGSWTCWLRL